jgi:hypothetical protein
MWEVIDTIASIWTATILAYAAIAGALVTKLGQSKIH